MSEGHWAGERCDMLDGCYFSHVNCFVDDFCLRRKGTYRQFRQGGGSTGIPPLAPLSLARTCGNALNDCSPPNFVVAALHHNIIAIWHTIPNLLPHHASTRPFVALHNCNTPLYPVFTNSFLGFRAGAAVSSLSSGRSSRLLPSTSPSQRLNCLLLLFLHSFAHT